jgi:3D (Asp-Asp-Asp) domain-containing protein
MRNLLTLFFLLLLSTCPALARNDLNGTYIATAYSDHGITASGEHTHRHVVAADPDVLPLGSRIKITKAGRYSGEYVVADTGAKFIGRRLDIYMPSEAAAIKFGVHHVRVTIISVGAGTQASTKRADRAVKADVAKDVRNPADEGAATVEDIEAKKADEQHKRGTGGAQSSVETASNRSERHSY